MLREWADLELLTTAITCRICRFFFDIVVSYGTYGTRYRIHVGKIIAAHDIQAGGIFSPYIGFDVLEHITWHSSDPNQCDDIRESELKWRDVAIVAYCHSSPLELPEIAFVAQRLVRERADFEKIKRWLRSCRHSHEGNC